MRLSNVQKNYLNANKRNHLVVGSSALAFNKLIYGNNALCLYTPNIELDGMRILSISLEYNHLSDSSNIELLDSANMVYIPSAEKAIIDSIKFINENFNEGELIEALQTYLNNNDDLSELYSIGEYYDVNRDTVDYWINEAREESDMSMG